ncbi:MAG: YlmC/YmxH family sporulation protein [Clostridia bacterium]|nr:YlmC/YmxH family sporulation protein [Clostridia bacterium]
MGRISKLKKKTVINVNDGRKIGSICDVDVDLEDGCVKGIMVRVCASYQPCGGKCKEVIIPFDRVVRAGGDVVLVRAEMQNILRFLEAPRP